MRFQEVFATPVAISRWEHADATREALLDTIEQRRASSPGIVRTNIEGWHSELDLPSWPEPAVQRLVRWIVERTAEATRLHNDGVDAADIRQWRLIGWANVNPPGGSNRSHHHAQRNWHWSACYYVKLGALEGTEDLGGALVFEERRTGLVPAANKDGPARRTWRHRPREGELVIFPSWLYHSVEAHFSPESRVSLAFNLHGRGLERSRMWEHQPRWAWRTFPSLMRRVAAWRNTPDLSRDSIPPGTDVDR